MNISEHQPLVGKGPCWVFRGIRRWMRPKAPSSCSSPVKGFVIVNMDSYYDHAKKRTRSHGPYGDGETPQALGIEKDFVRKVTFELGREGRMSIMSTNTVWKKGDISKEPNQNKGSWLGFYLIPQRWVCAFSFKWTKSGSRCLQASLNRVRPQKLNLINK